MNNQDMKVIETIKELLKAYGYYMDNLWHVDDINFICEQNNLPILTNNEAMEVFVIASEQFQGEVGLCWPQLEKAVNSYFRRKKLLSDSISDSIIEDCV